jgi:hypothetical protein
MWLGLVNGKDGTQIQVCLPSGLTLLEWILAPSSGRGGAIGPFVP